MARRPSGSDDDLVALARAGDADAYAELWRRHSAPARAAARSFTSLDADDVVAEAFTRILAAIRAGGGPTMGFRAYLLTAVRNVAREWGTRQGRTDTVDLTDVADPVEVEDTTIAAIEAGATASAFRSLPTRWQEALWYSEVENLKPRHFAPLLGLAPNAASALVVRARQGFRDAWIAQQLKTADSPDCRETLGLLGARTRDALSARDERKVAAHLDTCVGCALAWDEAQHVSSRLALVLLPLVVGVPGAAAYAAWTQSTAAQTAAAAVSARPGVRTATAVAGAAVVVAVVAGGAALALGGGFGADAGGEAAADAPASPPGPTGPTAAPEPPPQQLEPQPQPQPQPVPEPEPEPETRQPERSVVPVVSVPSAPSAAPTPTPTPTPSATPPTPGLPAPTMVVDVSAGPFVYPAISGKDAVPGATVEVVDETGRVRSRATADSAGAWRTDDLSGGAACATTPDAYLPAGAHTVAARQVSGGETSPASAPVAITVAAPPVITAPDDGGTASRTGFLLQLSGEPGRLVQRIKLPDPAPCRVPDMTLDADGQYSRQFTLTDAAGTLVTIGARYADADSRHGPAVFVTFRATS